MDENLRKKIIKSLNKKNAKQNLQKYEKYTIAELREEKKYLKIAIERDKKYNMASWFSMIALVVAMLSFIFILIGNISSDTEKLIEILERAEYLDGKIVTMAEKINSDIMNTITMDENMNSENEYKDSEMENIYSENEKMYSEMERLELKIKLISENRNANYFFMGELLIVFAMALAIFIHSDKSHLIQAVNIVTYEYEIKHIERLIEKRLGKHDKKEIDKVSIMK